MLLFLLKLKNIFNVFLNIHKIKKQYNKFREII